MKKFLHIMLTLFLLISTTGVTLSMHYCGGKLVSTSILTEAKSCCGDHCGCCENKTHHYEVKENFVSSDIVQNIHIAELDVLFPVYFVLNFDLSKIIEKPVYVSEDASPPPLIQTKLALLQTYLI